MLIGRSVHLARSSLSSSYLIKRTFPLVVLSLSFSTLFCTSFAVNSGHRSNKPPQETSQRTFFSQSSRNMQATRNDGMGGRGVTFVPSSGSYANVVIWMHGLGDTADGWASMMPSLGLTNTKFIVPTAKSRPITINMGSSMPGNFILK